MTLAPPTQPPPEGEGPEYTRRRSCDRWVVAGLLVVIAIVFSRCCTAEFLSWDDWLYVAGNPALQSPTWANLIAIWRSPEPGLYIPLPYTLWWLIAQSALVSDGAGHQVLNPWLFHAANVLLHAATAGAVYSLLRSMRLTALAAAAGAAVFALHPLAVESVAWTMGLRDVMAGLLSVLALRHGIRGDRWQAGGWVALAILSKPTSVAVWPMAIAIDALWLQLPAREIVRRQWPTAIVCAIGAAAAVAYSPLIHAHISALWQRPLIALDALAFYIGKWCWPIGLTFDYSRTPASIFASRAAYWTPAVPLTIAAAVLIFRRRGPAMVGLLFAIPLLPVLGLAPFAFQTISTVADHYTYLSLLGPAVGVGIALSKWPSRAGSVAVGVALAVMAGLSFRQTQFWKDDAANFNHAVAVNSNSAPAWNGLATAKQRSGDFDAAQIAAERAVAANSDYAFAHLTLMNLALARGDAAAVDHELNELERTYALQANFEPKLAAAVRGAIQRRKIQSKSHAQ